MRPDDIVIRTDLRPGDIGYITYLHAKIYSAEHQFNVVFESYVAQYMAKFAQHYDPGQSRIWIAEHAGQMVGSITIVGHSPTEAQLRWFILDPSYRGMGLGRQLMDAAMDFCREKCFQRVFLYTITELLPAGHLYQSAGFVLAGAPRKHSEWGPPVEEVCYERGPGGTRAPARIGRMHHHAPIYCIHWP